MLKTSKEKKLMLKTRKERKIKSLFISVKITDHCRFDSENPGKSK